MALAYISVDPSSRVVSGMRARVCQGVHRIRRIILAELEDDNTIVEPNPHLVRLLVQRKRTKQISIVRPRNRPFSEPETVADRPFLYAPLDSCLTRLDHINAGSNLNLSRMTPSEGG